MTIVPDLDAPKLHYIHSLLLLPDSNKGQLPIFTNSFFQFSMNFLEWAVNYVLLIICWTTFFSFHQLNAIIPECETSAEGSAEPEEGNEDLSTIDYNTLNVLREESQTTETQEAAPQEVSKELISTCVTPTRVKTIQRVLAQQDAKRHLCALRLLTHFFTKEELADSNTDGSHDKRGLDSGKLNSLKILVFSKFPASNSEEKAKAWRVIKGKINSKCRVARKSLKLPDSTPRSL